MLTAFDVGIGVLVLISAILATARGFTREVLSLATWAGSAAIGAYLALYQYDLVRTYFADELIGRIVLGVGAFLVALIVLHLITMSIADFVVDSRIGPLDRTLGFVFGVARGVLIAVVFVVFGANLFNFQSQSWATESRSWPVLVDLGDQLMAALPPDLEKQATELLRRGSGDDESPDETTPGAAPPDESTDLPEDSTPAATNT
ncbi:MAG: CvpA family protein [Devosia sp.]